MSNVVNKVELNKYDRFIGLRVGVMEILAHDTMECIKDSLDRKKKKLDKINKKNKHDFGLTGHVKKLENMQWQFKMMYRQLENLMQWHEENMTDAQYITLVNASKHSTDLIEGKKI